MTLRSSVDQTARVPKVVISAFVLSIFVYCLPQYRLIPHTAFETFAIGLFIVLASMYFMSVSRTTITGILLFGFLVTLVNLFSQVMSPFPPTQQFYKIAFLVIGFVFITDYLVRFNSVVQSTFKAHILLTSILVIYGSYIYIVGDIEGTQTTEVGWKTIGRYWGFRYTRSTRNDDIAYIVPSCLIMLSYALFSTSKRKKTFCITLFCVFATVTFLSFSRGHILALGLAAIAALGLKLNPPHSYVRGVIQRKNRFLIFIKMFRNLIVISLVVFSGLYVVGIFIPEFDLLVNLGLKLLSIIDSSGQADALNMTSSNSIRKDIYFMGLDLFFKYPLGVGAENFQYAAMAEGHGRYWGENTYLEYMVAWGILGIFIVFPLFLYPVVKLYYMFKMHRRFLDLTYFSISLYIAIACLFNVLIGNLYVYLLMSMIYAYILNHKKLIKKENGP